MCILNTPQEMEIRSLCNEGYLPVPLVHFRAHCIHRHFCVLYYSPARQVRSFKSMG